MQPNKIEQNPLDAFRTQIKREIKKKYPTIERFCFENDIQKSILSRLFSGKQREFKIKTLVRIAKALNKNVEVRIK